MIYVLILWSHVYGGDAVVTQEFTTKEACQNAVIQIKQAQKDSWIREQTAICVPKGTSHKTEAIE